MNLKARVPLSVFASGAASPTLIARGTPLKRMGCARRSCVPELLAAVAEISPSSIALSSPLNGESMTYGQLNARANQLAGHLQSLGVGPDVPVAVCLDRSFDYVVSALAVWKAGGAYLPIDRDGPATRRALVIADAQAPVLITDSTLITSAPHVVNLDLDAPKFEQANAAAAVETKRENLAYIIYTSGSTGQPKGVEVTHGNLLNLVFWHRRTFGVSVTDRASHVAGLAFDAAVWELWPYLTAGASVVLADDATRTSADQLRQWMIAQRITISFVPTTLAAPMLAAQWPCETKLRYMLTGADTLHHYPSPSLPFRVVNNYGPTECTVVATSGVVPPVATAAVAPPIGAAIAHTQVYLLDGELQPVAPGETGEIYIGGSSVAKGYRGQPGLTAERFLADPFRPVADARMFRTGDLGCLLASGEIAFRGRIDGFEKIRGHRVEPDEIANALARHPQVASCAVAARDSGNGEKKLVGYVLLRCGVAPSGTDLREFLAEQLPDYMIPSAFVRVHELPLNSNGKLDRKALPEPTPENTLAGAGFRTPESPVEIQIAGILAQLLGIERVGLDDNFFLLGGHSLLGAQLVLRIGERFGVDLTLRHLFAAQTAEKLAQEVERLWLAKLETMSDEEAASMLAQLEHA
jgi:amino acid adenylation domain-containing protein